MSHAISVSIDYKKQLKNLLEFNGTAVDQMAEKLKVLLASEDKIVRLSTSSPELTAGKVLAALQRLKGYNKEDSCLVGRFKNLQHDGINKDKIKKLLNATKNSHRLLVNVCADDDSVDCHQFDDLKNLIPEGKGKKREKGRNIPAPSL